MLPLPLLPLPSSPLPCPPFYSAVHHTILWVFIPRCAILLNLTFCSFYFFVPYLRFDQGVFDDELRLLVSDIHTERSVFRVCTSFQYSAAKELSEYMKGTNRREDWFECWWDVPIYFQSLSRLRQQSTLKLVRRLRQNSIPILRPLFVERQMKVCRTKAQWRFQLWHTTQPYRLMITHLLFVISNDSVLHFILENLFSSSTCVQGSSWQCETMKQRISSLKIFRSEHSLCAVPTHPFLHVTSTLTLGLHRMDEKVFLDPTGGPSSSLRLCPRLKIDEEVKQRFYTFFRTAVRGTPRLLCSLSIN